VPWCGYFKQLRTQAASRQKVEANLIEVCPASLRPVFQICRSPDVKLDNDQDNPAFSAMPPTLVIGLGIGTVSRTVSM
jgi:hypothetical protein